MNLAAFGKHPGWNDHIDDIGLETDRLVALKRILYLEGIGAAIDSGSWDKLHETQRLPGFAHVLIWRTAEDTVIARMWSSSDGKGRTKYPMIVAAQVRGVPLRVALDRVLPALERIQGACQGTGSADDVRSIMASHRASLRDAVAGIAPGEPELMVPADAVKSLAADPAFAGGDGLQRILYQVEREMSAYLTIVSGGKSRLGTPIGGSRSRMGDLRPQQIRVPACGAEPGEVGLRWVRFLLSMLDPASTMVLIIPVGESWVDLIVGEPVGSQFFCIRATPKSIPLTSDIPYTLDPGFMESATRLIESPLPAGDLVIGRSSGHSAQPLKAKLGWSRQAKLMGIGLGAVVVLGAAAAVVLSGGSGGGERAASGERGSAAPEGRSGDGGGRGSSSQAAAEGVGRDVASLGAAVSGAVDEGPWRELCGMYQDWAGLLQRRLDAPRRERFSADPTLAALVACFGTEASPNDPWSIAGAERGPISHLIREPPAAVRTAEGVRRTAEALACLRTASSSLSPAQWRRLADLQVAGHAFRERGWTGAHDAVAATIGLVKFEAGADLAAAIDAVLALSEAVDAVQRRWGVIDQMAGTLSATGDPVLAAFRGWAERHGAAPAAAGEDGAAATVREIERRLAEAEAVGAELTRFVEGSGWASVDQDAFKAGSRSHRALASGRAADQGMFRDWLFEAPSYPAPDLAADPRRGWQQTGEGERQPQELAAASAAAEALRAYMTKHGAPVEGEAAAELTQLDELQDLAAELNKRRWSGAERGEIERLSARVVSRSAELELALERRLSNLRNTYERTFAEVVQRLRARDEVTASPSLNEAWRVQRDRVIDELAGDAAGGNAAGLLERAGAIEDAVHALAAAAPAIDWPAELGSGPVLAAVEAEGAARREALLSEAAAELMAGGDTAAIGERVTRRYSAERERLVTLAQDASRLAGLLGAGYGLSERPEGQGSSAGEVLEQLQSSLADASPALRGAVSPLLERTERLRAIAASTDRAQLAGLVSEARADTPARAIAAWRRLGELSWPSGLAELEQERELRGQLGRVIGNLQDEGHKSQLERELAQQAVVRFERAAAGIASSDEMEAALAMMASLGVEPGELTSPALRFNAMVHEFKQRLAQTDVGEAGAQELARAFAARATAEAGAALESNEVARGFVDALAAALDEARTPQEKPRIDLSTVGPGALGDGWQTEEIDGGAAVIYRREVPTPGGRGTEPLELRFVRVVSGDGRESYLLADELSLGQFMGIVRGLGDWDDVAGLLHTFIGSTDPRRGPRVWEWEENSRGVVLVMRPSTTWLRESHSMGSTPHYPADLAPAKPSPEHPMQHIPPDAAIYAAALVGCRLPTTAEWTAAHEVHAAGVPLERHNLRDAAWQRQQAYVEEVRRTGKLPEWPDSGVFWPGGSRSDQRGLEARSHDWDDGELWFATVGTGQQGGRQGGGQGGAAHLVGNVAEFVFDQPEVFAGLASPEPEAIRHLLEASASSLGVIGGSALSAPEIPVDVRQDLDIDEALEIGFADVGVRLAFVSDGSAGAPLGVLGTARRLIRGQVYILGD